MTRKVELSLIGLFVLICLVLVGTGVGNRTGSNAVAQSNQNGQLSDGSDASVNQAKPNLPAPMGVTAQQINEVRNGGPLATAGSRGDADEGTTIEVTPTGISIKMGESLQFTARSINDDGQTLDISKSVRWISINTKVATVDSSGLVQGLSPGKCEIIAYGERHRGGAVIDAIISNPASIEIIE